MYQDDYFVVLQPDQPEEIITKQELLEKLLHLLAVFPDVMPKELLKLSTLEEKAIFLRDNFCEWNIAAGNYLEWYAVRLEK